MYLIYVLCDYPIIIKLRLLCGKDITLDMRQIPHALETYGYLVPKHILNEVFGGSNKYKKSGTKSAKKLRNGIMHSYNEKDINEMLLREIDIYNSMDTFLNYFSS